MAIKYSTYDSSSGNIFSLNTITGQSGVFTTQLSGATITGNNVQAGTVTGVSGTFTTQISGNLYKASGNVTVITSSGDVRPYGLYGFPATAGTSGFILKTNADGSTAWVASGGDGLSGETNSGTPFETSLGSEAGLVNTGVNNTFIGYRAGTTNTTGTNNTAVGSFSFRTNTISSGNVAVGFRALYLNTTGNNNVAVGNLALFSNTIGINNVAVGSDALYSNTTGTNNIAIGVSGLRANTTGINNVAVGANALNSNTIASGNVAVGISGLYANTTGTNNVAIGTNALNAVTIGTGNTSIGNTAGNTLTTGVNNTCIGNNAQASAATVTGEFTLGNADVVNLRCADTTISTLSDVRDKTNIKDLPFGVHFIQALRPVQFDWATRDGSRKGRKDFGWLAHELDQVEQQFGTQEYTRLVHKDNPLRWEADPMKTYPILVKAVQELAERVEKLEAASRPTV